MHWDIILCLVSNKRRDNAQMPLIMKNIVWLKAFVWKWRYLHFDESGLHGPKFYQGLWHRCKYEAMLKMLYFKSIIGGFKTMKMLLCTSSFHRLLCYQLLLIYEYNNCTLFWLLYPDHALMLSLFFVYLLSCLFYPCVQFVCNLFPAFSSQVSTLSALCHVYILCVSHYCLTSLPLKFKMEVKIS